MNTPQLWLLIVLLLAGVIWLAFRWLLPALAWQRLLHSYSRWRSPARGRPRTPADLNLPYQIITIHSGNRQLRGWLVSAARGTQSRKAVLIFHDLGETANDWLPVQKYLWEQGVSSLVFDYRGFGLSDGPVDLATLQADAAAALRTFVGRVGLLPDKFILGAGLGAGVMLASAAEYPNFLQAAILIAPYTTLADALPPEIAQRELLLRRLPGAFNSLDAIGKLRIPLFFLNTQPNGAAPPAASAPSATQTLYTAALAQKKQHTLSNLTTPLLTNPPQAFMPPVVAYIKNLKGQIYDQ